jgi:hypothetical protein
LAAAARDETTAAHIAFLSMREVSTPSTFRDAVAVLAMLAVVITIIIGLTYLLAPTTEHGPRPATPFAHRF